MFIPWWQVLRLSGEHVHPVALDDATSNATLRKRYGRRIDALEAAGYFLPVNMETGQPSHRPPHYRHTDPPTTVTQRIGAKWQKGCAAQEQSVFSVFLIVCENVPPMNLCT